MHLEARPLVFGHPVSAFSTLVSVSMGAFGASPIISILAML